MIFDGKEQAASSDERRVTGEIFGLAIPADAQTLVSDSADFLTRAFHVPYDRRQAVGAYALRVPEEKLLQWANRMFDFIDRYPKLVPLNVWRTRRLGDMIRGL